MNTRQSRQSFLGDDSPVILAGAKVGIVGLCGGGSHVAQQLAHAGIGNFVISDFDYVEEPNLNRMVGSRPGDATSKRPKIEVIGDLIYAIKPDAIVQFVGPWQEGGDLLRTCDIVVGCVDSFSVRDELERFCRRFLIPYIDIGMDVHVVPSGYSISGQVAASLPGGSCLWCNGILTEHRLAQEQQRYGAAGGNPQVIWPNGVLASIAVGHVVSILLPWSTELPLSSLIEYDGNRHITKPSARLKFLKDQPCLHFPFEGQLGDPFFSFSNESVS